ncbi:type II toxin-antitoxin system HicB family antitoxin [Candidatus Wolfebacteria bacterium]|nr:type II toxin-antitoxin system HicB family antitoxin [Candidatus Wolfebacteria bacterium]
MKQSEPKKTRFHLVFRPEPEGGFTVLVPSLPGCITYGKTLTTAKRMAADAIQGYCQSLHKHNEPIPSDDNIFISSIEFYGVKRSKAPAHA